MNTNRFTSVFANDLAEYVKFKEQMGFYGRSRITYLGSSNLTGHLADRS